MRKYIEEFELFVSLESVNVAYLRQRQQSMRQSLQKFKKHFHNNFGLISAKEQQHQISPRFSICYLDLATHLGIVTGGPAISEEASQPGTFDKVMTKNNYKAKKLSMPSEVMLASKRTSM